MRFRYLTATGLAVLAVLALASCENNRISGEIVGPLVGPRIEESQLALDVVDGAPIGITDIFTLGEFVNLWVHWIDLEPPNRVDIKWHDPIGTVLETGLDLDQPLAEQVTVFTLQLGQFAPVGRWEVEIFLDDELMRSHAFIVVDAIIG